MWDKGTIMELSTNTTKFENTIISLKENMKNKSKILPSKLRDSLIKVLEKNNDLVTVKGGKLILSVGFYQVLIKERKLNKETEDVDSAYYNFFRKLRKYRYIHANSSYFPKKLALITLNPTLPSLYKGNMQNLSNYSGGKEALYLSTEINKNLIDAYIDLRLYQPFILTDKETKEIKTSNIIFINEQSAYIYLEDKGIFDNIDIPPYRIILVKGLKLINLLKQDKAMYPFHDDNLENELKKHKQEFFSEMSFQEIRMTTQNYILMKSSPIETKLATSRTIMSQATIAELNSLYPSTVPQHLTEVEERRISNSIDRSKEIDDEEDFIDGSFSLEEFDYFTELLKTKTNSSFMKKLEPTKRELNRYINSKQSEAHGILIAEYIVHLLESITGDKKSRKIAISTFRNYYSLVKKHLFENIEDLSSVQTHEINKILQNLAINRYKDKSIAKVKSLISDFFKFHGAKHNVIPMNLASYPKSLVFESEINLILEAINDSYTNEKKEVGTNYKILRDKAIVLIARYTGLRKNELRSRLMKDVYIYGNELCIDVNSKGLRKLDLRLKTISAKRRVCAKITDDEHLKIIINYMKAREKVRNKNPFLFLHIDDHNKIKSKVVKEDIFNQIGKVIQGVTGRYTSFHSLRHTYATYAVRDILLCEEVNPYKMIDLAVKMGHTSPEITLKKYTHRSVIEYRLTDKDTK